MKIDNINCVIIEPKTLDISKDGAESLLEEAVLLTKAINLNVIFAKIFNLNKITPSYYIGKGQLEEVKEFTEQNQVDVVLINTNDLSAIQQRNLENFLNIKVIDRTGLIIDIFADRAKTLEGKLQVELAYLEYQKSRVIKAWSHLERQRGGGAKASGPGETQKELDRRIINDKIVLLKKQLEKVKKTRSNQRKSRKKIPYPIISLIGYTNSGKSTLFNTLTKSKELSKDLLFATLDPKMKLLSLNFNQKAIISDTVGFISNLPHQLVYAFKATLEEVLEADLLLHVIDGSNESSEEIKKQKEAVLEVLEEIGVPKEEYSKRAVEIYNKIDKLDEEGLEELKNNTNFTPAVFTSALKETNINTLVEVISNFFIKDNIKLKLTINLLDSQLLANIYDKAPVISKKVDEEAGTIELEVVISEKNLNQLKAKYINKINAKKL